MKVWLWPYTAHSMMSVCNNAPLVNPQQKQPLKQCWLLEPSCTHVSRHCDRRQHCFTEEKVVHNSAFGTKEQVFSSKSLKPWLNYWSTTWDSNRGPQWLLYVALNCYCGTSPFKDLPQLSVGLNPQPLIVEDLKMTSPAVADLRTQL